MILYLDTSALVKLYVDEEGTATVQDLVTTAELVGTSTIAYVEARAALARRQREDCFSKTSLRRIVHDLDRDWDHYLLIDISDPLIRRASGLAETRRLRAYDAVHLASACLLNDRLPNAVGFTCWDVDLNAAASQEGLKILNDERIRSP